MRPPAHSQQVEEVGSVISGACASEFRNLVCTSSVMLEPPKKIRAFLHQQHFFLLPAMTAVDRLMPLVYII